MNLLRPGKTRFIFITFAVFAGLAFLAGVLASTRVSDASTQTSQEIKLQTAGSDRVVVRIFYTSQENLDAIAGQLDIWEHNRRDKYILAAVYPAQQDWLMSSGYRVEVDQEKTALLQAPQAALDPRYYYFDDEYYNSNDRYVVDFLNDTQAAYPNLTELFDIGNAWQGDNGGYNRDMLALRITNEDPAYGPIEDKPVFFMMAEIHAREVSTPELAIRYIKYLTSGYNGLGGYDVDADVTWLVNHNAVYVLVMQNPDGYRVNQQDTNEYRRKNMDNDDGCGTPDYWGVDLNRNHSFLWGCCGGSSPDPCSETYRGLTAASEPETVAYQNFITSLIPDQNGPNDDETIGEMAPITTTGIFVSLHSYSDEILWPWYLDGMPPAPNQDQMEDIGRKLATLDTYYDPTGTIGYSVDGSANYWTYGKLGIPAYTFEVGPSSGSCGNFFPAYGCQDGIDGMPRNFWAENRPVFIYMHKIARTPYMTAYGPDAQNVTATPYTVIQGEPVDLAALISDDRFEADPLYPISAAEYFIDAPGEDGAGIAMLPTDGIWGENSEDAEAVVDTTSIAPGKHYLLVHGLNDQGDWGPFTAVFFEVQATDYIVSLTPDEAAAQADPGEVVTYTMLVTNLGLNEDSYTIDVESMWPTSAPTSIGPLASQESAEFEVQVSIPITATSGESDVALVTVSGTGVSDNASLTTTANSYDLEIYPPDQAGEGYPGSHVAYTVWITNTGNAVDSYEVAASGVWTTTPETGVVGPLAAGESAGLVVTVSVPLDALPGEADTAEISLSSQGNPAQTQSASLTTTALLRGPVVSPHNSTGYGDPGQTITHTLVVTNVGDTTDTYSITVNDANWVTNAPAMVGPLTPGEPASIYVTVVIPADALAGDSDGVAITFSSQLPGTLPATADLETIANTVYGLQAAVETDTLETAAPGIPLTYTLTVTNLGNITDTFDLSVTSNWAFDAPLSTGPLAAGESAQFTIVVFVPVEAHSGDENLTTVTLTSQGNSSKTQIIELTAIAAWYNLFVPFTTK
jgi:uncharacterized membrane protein